MKNRFKVMFVGVLLTSTLLMSCTGGEGVKTTANEKSANGEVLLRYNATEGEEYISEMNMNSTMEGNKGFKMDLDFDMLTKIGDVESDGSYLNSIIISKVLMNMEMNGMKIVYNSDLKEQEGMGANMAAVYSKIINLDLKYKMSNRGETLELPDLKELFGDNEAAKSQFSQTSDMLKNANIGFPEELVKVGSSWEMNVESEEENKSGLIVKMNYTVKEIKDTEVVLTFTGDMTMNTDSVKNIGNITGESIVNKQTGFLMQMDMKQNMEMFMMGRDIKLLNIMKIKMKKK